MRKGTRINKFNVGIIERNVFETPYGYKYGNIDPEDYDFEPGNKPHSAVPEHKQHRHRYDKRGSDILKPDGGHDLIEIVTCHLEKITRILYKCA